MSRSRTRTWPEPGKALPHPIVDNHTHLETILATTDAGGWRDRPDDAAVRSLRSGDDPAPRLRSGDEDAVPDGTDDPGTTPLTVEDHLARAAAVGVTRAVQIGCDLTAIGWTDTAVRQYPELVGGLAIHPNEAVRHAGIEEVAPDGNEPRFEEHHGVPLDEALAWVWAVAQANDRIRVIGETGLDFFRAGARGRSVQVDAFRSHIALAKELGLVLQIHDRDAHREVVDVLLADGAPDRTVFHCFSGDAAMARLAAEHGWYLSFAGPLTYPANDSLRAALAVTPPSRVLLESDAPYLPPHPHRGRPNGPHLVPETARTAAEVLGLPLPDLCARVWNTSHELYGPW